MEVKDIYTNIDRDFDFLDGDFIIDYSDNTHIQNIIESFPGYWKEFPSIGVGIMYYLNSSGKQQELNNEISRQIKQDGYSINVLEISDDFEIEINCTRD